MLAPLKVKEGLPVTVWNMNGYPESTVWVAGLATMLIGACAVPDREMVTGDLYPNTDGLSTSTVSPADATSTPAWMVQNGAARVPPPASEQAESALST